MLTKSKFILVKHDAKKARLHYDLRFRIPKSKLWASFACRKEVPTDPGLKILAIRTHDHTEEDALFIGEIKEGYGAGKLSKLDDGVCEIEKYSNAHIIINFKGKKLKDVYHMVSLGNVKREKFKDQQFILFKGKMK